MDMIDDVLSDRKQRYGDFKKTSPKLIALQDILWDGVDHMPAHVKRAANMILEKLVRAVTGDPFYDDNWIDIQGYARLALTCIPKMHESHGQTEQPNIDKSDRRIKPCHRDLVARDKLLSCNKLRELVDAKLLFWLPQYHAACPNIQWIHLWALNDNGDLTVFKYTNIDNAAKFAKPTSYFIDDYASHDTDDIYASNEYCNIATVLNVLPEEVENG